MTHTASWVISLKHGTEKLKNNCNHDTQLITRILISGSAANFTSDTDSDATAGLRNVKKKGIFLKIGCVFATID